MLLVVSSLLIAALLVEWSPLAGTRGLTVGKPAPSDIRATSKISVTDEELTLAKRREARDTEPDVFVYDALVLRSIEERVTEAFEAVRSKMASTQEPGDLQLAREAFEEDLGVPVDDIHLSSIESGGFSAQLERDVLGLLRAVMAGPVSQQPLDQRRDFVLIRVEGSSRIEEAIPDPSIVRPVAEVRKALQQIASQDGGRR